MRVLNKLIKMGGSVVVVEHIWTSFVGPIMLLTSALKQVTKAGNIVAQGTPDDIMKVKKRTPATTSNAILGDSVTMGTRC